MTDDYTYAELVDQCAQMAALVRERDAEIERLKKEVKDLELWAEWTDAFWHE